MKALLASLAAWVARTGESQSFIAFMAHFWFAAFVVAAAGHFGGDWHIVVFFAVLCGSALKEFAFDANYEHDPPQTAADNMHDFLGYATGAALGLAIYF